MTQAQELKSQEKFGFTVTDKDGEPKRYAPFDTVEAAGRTAKALRELGLEVSDVEVVYTVAIARNLVTYLRAQVVPVPDQPQTPQTPQAEIVAVDETESGTAEGEPAETVEPDPAPEPTEAPTARRGRRATK